MESSDGSFGAGFRFTLLTTDVELAGAGDAAGVHRIGIDIEREGKAARQRSRAGARISDHTLAALPRLATRVCQARLFCRLDPPHAGTGDQIERALDLGATSLMLPFFHHVADARTFVTAVAGRAEVVLLVETSSAAGCIGSLAELDGVDEIMIGLNDLAWDFGLESPFQLLSTPMMERWSHAVIAQSRRFGVGGLGQWDDSRLTIPPDLVYARYPSLRATGAWLARSFLTNQTPATLGTAVDAARARLTSWACKPAEVREHARIALWELSGLRRGDAARLGALEARGA